MPEIYSPTSCRFCKRKIFLAPLSGHEGWSKVIAYYWDSSSNTRRHVCYLPATNNNDPIATAKSEYQSQEPTLENLRKHEGIRK